MNYLITVKLNIQDNKDEVVPIGNILIDPNYKYLDLKFILLDSIRIMFNHDLQEFIEDLIINDKINYDKYLMELDSYSSYMKSITIYEN